VSSDTKFYGVYRAIVADAADPEKLGRVSLIVPQVLGQSVTNWAWPIGGAISQNKYPYGTFLTTSDQNVGTSATKVTGWAKETSNKINLENNKFYVEEEGDYLINLSAVVKKDTLGFSNLSIWLKKNETNVPNSAMSLTSLGLHSAHTVTSYAHVAPNGGGTVTGNHSDMTVVHSGTAPSQNISYSFILNLLAEEYLEFFALADASGSYLNYSAAGSAAATPGAVATISLVGKYLPQPNAAVWAMFEGGDPNFPLWIGAS
jgi:hypothetical protein